MSVMTTSGADDGTPVKAFISYAWTSKDHTERVRRLADYLRANGIDAILYQYALQPGMDTDRFMEQVAHQNVQKVIAVCDTNYVQKANDRTGGVGKEGSIMSKHLYDQLMSQGSQEEQSRRFVAVIFGLTDGEVRMPAMFGSSKYIDMSTEEKYDANLDQLLRFILDKPELVAPPIGKVPAHLQGTPAAAPPTWASAQAFRRAVEEDRRVNPTFRAYLDDLLKALVSLSPPVTDQGQGDDLAGALDAADAFLPIRNEFVELMRIAAHNEALNAELLGNFLEEAVNATSGLHNVSRAVRTVMDLVLMELMLYFTAICVRERQETVLTDVTDRTYFVHRNGIQRTDGFGTVYNVSDEFPRAYNRIKGREYKAPIAEWLQERATLATVTFTQLQEADVLLTIKSRNQRLDSRKSSTRPYVSVWYHPTALYWGRHGQFELFVRFTSRQVMNRWLPFFGASSAAELQTAIQEALGDSYHQMTEGWGTLKDDLNIDRFGTMN
jgi:hypothetical protein